MTQFCYEQIDLYNRYVFVLGQLPLFLLLVIEYRDDEDLAFCHVHTCAEATQQKVVVVEYVYCPPLLSDTTFGAFLYIYIDYVHRNDQPN